MVLRGQIRLQEMGVLASNLEIGGGLSEKRKESIPSLS